MFVPALALAVTMAAASPPPPNPAAVLVGLWGAQREFGPSVSGQLTIDARTSPWRASIGGYTPNVTSAPGSIGFDLGPNVGTFAGRIAGPNEIDGIWSQPATLLDGRRFASPVTLHRDAQNVWRGTVRPLRDRFAFYLAVTQATTGAVRAYIRNPEQNYGMGRPFVVHLEGLHATLANADDANDTIDGTYDAKAGTLTIETSDYGRFTLTRRGRDDAVGFYPTTPASPWTYRVPIATSDGWQTGSLRSVGIDPTQVSPIVSAIAASQSDSFRSPYVQSLLIARHGKLALEAYFYGFDMSRLHDTRSAAKTITGLMLGQAIDRGAPVALTTGVLGAFPEYASVANPDPRKARVTVEDLLTMTSGLACDDNDDKSPGNEDAMYARPAVTDYYKYALDLPMAGDPGTSTAVYCTIGINLLGGVIRNAAKTSLVDLFDRYVARPLQIGDYALDLMPDGDAYVGGGIYLRPRDALKIGQTYLNRGVWNGKRIVSARWAALSEEQHSAFAASAYAPGHGYGFAWHLFTPAIGGRTVHEYMAQGNGGQLIAVLPELDATVLVMAANYQNFPTWRAYFERLIPNLASAMH